MMLFKLALGNLKKSLKDYLIYFVTLIIGVAVFYVFNAVEKQTIMLNVSNTTAEVIELMNNMMSAISVFVSFVLGFLIVYANNFLLKRRKKEFGIYMLLGMGKRKISTVLVVETVSVGIMSLATGLFVGILVSQGMSVLIANMFEADMTQFTFVISGAAIVKTIVYFLVIYVVVLLLNTIIIGRAKLIELISAGKKSQKIRIRNPWIGLVVFLAACGILASAYYNVTANMANMNSATDLLMQIVKGCVGTFLVFWSLSGMFLFLAKRSRKLYYKKLCCFTVKEFASRIHTTIFSGTIICLMLFMTICILSSAMSVNKAVNDNLKELTPVDVNFYHYNGGADIKFDGITDIFEKTGIDTSVFKDAIEVQTYASEDLVLKTTLGEYYQEVKGQFGDGLENDLWEEVIRVSDYNKVAKVYDLPKYELKDDEYVVSCDFDSMKNIRDEALKRGVTLTFGQKEYHPKFEECQEGFLVMTANHTNMGFFIVPDNTDLSQMGQGGCYYIANYKAKSEEKIKELDKYLQSEAFDNQLNPEDKTWPYINTYTRIMLRDSSIGLTAMMIFIGIYMGFIFMISGAAILSLKQLTETSDSRQKYVILRRLGADEKMIRKSMRQQCSLFFGMPLLLAVVHSVFGIQVCLNILETFGKTGLLLSIVLTGIVILLVYGMYYLITYLCCKRIINE